MQFLTRHLGIAPPFAREGLADGCILSNADVRVQALLAIAARRRRLEVNARGSVVRARGVRERACCAEVTGPTQEARADGDAVRRVLVSTGKGAVAAACGECVSIVSSGRGRRL